VSDTSAAPTMVTTTYLHLPSRDAFRPVLLDDPDLLLLEAHEPLPAFYRFLYGTVGREYDWTERRDWSDERLHEYLSRPSVTLLPLYVRGTPAGYVELNTASDEEAEVGTELAYLGLFPAFHGRGLGKHLLSVGVARAFADGTSSVWLHTCTLDGPHALANYLARGFVPYKTETEEYRRPEPA